MGSRTGYVRIENEHDNMMMTKTSLRLTCSAQRIITVVVCPTKLFGYIGNKLTVATDPIMLYNHVRIISRSGYLFAVVATNIFACARIVRSESII